MDTPEQIEAKRNVTSALVTILKRSDSEDGLMTIPTLDWEVLERAWHNIDIEFLPSHPDSTVRDRCRHTQCAYCRRNDYAAKAPIG